MRQLPLLALLALAACATTPANLPSPRYADAASRGAFAALLAGRPNAAQVDAATESWSNALGDSFACRVPMRQVLDAGLVGALEIGAMNAAASGGGEREVREGVGRYVGQLASLAVSRREPPSAGRCEARRLGPAHCRCRARSGGARTAQRADGRRLRAAAGFAGAVSVSDDPSSGSTL